MQRLHGRMEFWKLGCKILVKDTGIFAVCERTFMIQIWGTKVETLHSNSNWKQQYIYCICTVIVGWSVYMKRMCFTFTVQIMRRIPILMLYFWDHYSRLLESWFLLSHERVEKYILRYGYQGLLVACLVLLFCCKGFEMM